jgi:hypothetical protein
LALSEKDVARLYVQVNDLVLVNVFQRGGNLTAYPYRF